MGACPCHRLSPGWWAHGILGPPLAGPSESPWAVCAWPAALSTFPFAPKLPLWLGPWMFTLPSWFVVLRILVESEMN